ncbi:hypothetical protein [Halobacillus sp. A5]|uniref:hypothetical protein n=1 Tax=Halobacillus sp. A5 TaxID=2880263 RepID=UPI0020A63C35|nr:hypothetical protein [Halobacillus sp. A5]MCP3027830.1 hypothetical protein [Halobacillus sp. A5]
MTEEEQLVIDLLKSRQEGYDEDLHNIMRIWDEFCQSRMPVIEKPNAYAAALEYLAGQVFTGPNTTQKALAEKYETSSSQMSAKYRTIENEVAALLTSFVKARYEELLRENEELWEERKSLHFEDLKDELLKADTYPGDYSQTLTREERSTVTDLIYDVMDAPSPEKTKLLYEMHKLHPYHPDLYNLAGDMARLVKDRKTLYFKAMIHAENAPGESLFPKER